MQIDRLRFLTLTTAIAATSCTPAAPPVVDVPAQDIPVPSSEPITAPEPPPPNVSVVDAGNDDVAPPAAVADNHLKAQACPPAQNNVGSPASCAALAAPGPTCESFSDTKAQCNDVKSILKNRVAEKVAACHLAKSGTPAVCKFNLMSDCIAESLDAACLDLAAKPVCAKVMQSCAKNHWSKIDVDGCEAAVSAVSDKFRGQLVSCISESCALTPCFYHSGPVPPPAPRPPPTPRPRRLPTPTF